MVKKRAAEEGDLRKMGKEAIINIILVVAQSARKWEEIRAGARNWAMTDFPRHSRQNGEYRTLFENLFLISWTFPVDDGEL